MSSDAANKRIRVFISSTFEDLGEYRATCVESLERLRDTLQIDIVDMQKSGADARPPTKKCLDEVKKCGILVGILGMRYGPPADDQNTDKSLVQLEYEEAKSRGLRRLMYLIDEERARIPPRCVSDGPSADRLKRFKEELCSYGRGYVVGKFRDPGGLACQVVCDVIREVQSLRDPDSLAQKLNRAITEGLQFICATELPGGGWSGGATKPSSCWETACSMLALKAGSRQAYGAQLYRGQGVLMLLRNKCGAWCCGLDPNPNPHVSAVVDTAAALTALHTTGYQEEQELNRIADLLRSAQDSSGGWPDRIGQGNPTTASTAWAIKSLIEVTESTPPPCWKGAEWLKNAQKPNGAWGPDQSSHVISIGKTRDALIALSLFDPDFTSAARKGARQWLLDTAECHRSPEEYDKIPIEYHGMCHTIEKMIYFLEASFHVGISADEEPVKTRLEWLLERPWYYFTPQAILCLTKYRDRVG